MEMLSRLKVVRGDMEDLVEFSVVQKVISVSIPLLHQLHLSALNTQNKCYAKWKKALRMFLFHTRGHAQLRSLYDVSRVTRPSDCKYRPNFSSFALL